jgi:hypothetical protein
VVEVVRLLHAALAQASSRPHKSEADYPARLTFNRKGDTSFDPIRHLIESSS